jgi:hypothetical protein
MITHIQRAAAAALVAAAFLIGTPRAAAESVTLFFDQTTNAPTITGTLNGSPTPALNPGPYYWFQNGVPPNSSFPPPTVTFCAEAGQLVSSGKQYTFDVTTLAGLPAVGSQLKADYITELYGRHYNPAWNDPAFASRPPNDPAYIDSVAFQLALWELIHDGPGNLDLASGNLRMPDPTTGNSVYDAAYARAQDWLTGPGGQGLTGDPTAFHQNFQGFTLVGLTDPKDPKGSPANPQDQIVIVSGVIPAPAGAVLAGLGVLVLAGRARLLRRKPAA